ncbi:MAG: ATP-grasp domain-containing protein [Bacteroidales bacterium]|nr:ATP-grasp domain-containing protein [Bacteroidales bacterium]
MNFIFISPNFPQTYWNFCERLRRHGVTVLGIGDAPYESLAPELKANLNDYYFVQSLEDYDQAFRAVAWYSHRYGKIDWLESNNEYWLETDARLRTDFNITSGVQLKDIAKFKSKAAQKVYYAKGNVPTARQHKVTTLEAAKAFLEEVGYPVIVKPEVGVGAEATYKVSTDAELNAFFATRPAVPYVMEEFVTGDIYSYDAIVDSHGNPLFESSAHFPPSVMDVVIENLDMPYYVLPEVPEQLKERGRATLKAFGVKSRFVHFEFFRLTKARKGLGKVGDFVGLETNMRPAGGYTPDMMNYAHSTDVYTIWADMVAADKRLLPESGDDHWCAYYGRRDAHSYVHNDNDVLYRYGGQMAMTGRIPAALAPDLGERMFMAHIRSERELEEYFKYLSE